MCPIFSQFSSPSPSAQIAASRRASSRPGSTKLRSGSRVSWWREMASPKTWWFNCWQWCFHTLWIQVPSQTVFGSIGIGYEKNYNGKINGDLMMYTCAKSNRIHFGHLWKNQNATFQQLCFLRDQVVLKKKNTLAEFDRWHWKASTITMIALGMIRPLTSLLQLAWHSLLQSQLSQLVSTCLNLMTWWVRCATCSKRWSPGDQRCWTFPWRLGCVNCHQGENRNASTYRKLKGAGGWGS